MFWSFLQLCVIPKGYIVLSNKCFWFLQFFSFVILVTAILSIPGNKVSGKISTMIGLLSNLEYLDFSNNNLRGDIPTELTLLTKLSKFEVGFFYIYIYIYIYIWGVSNV